MAVCSGALMNQIADALHHDARHVKDFPAVDTQTGVWACRIDAPIYFANVEWIRGRIDKYRMRVDSRPSTGPIFFVVLDMSPVPFVDSTGTHGHAQNAALQAACEPHYFTAGCACGMLQLGATSAVRVTCVRVSAGYLSNSAPAAGMHALHEIVQTLRSDGQQLVLANPSRKVQAQLRRVNLLNLLGQKWVFVRTADAVKVCRAATRNKLAEHQQKAVERGDVEIPVRPSSSSEEP
jgi:MFS superfamily sulfate permease-like transporter